MSIEAERIQSEIYRNRIAELETGVSRQAEAIIRLGQRNVELEEGLRKIMNLSAESCAIAHKLIYTQKEEA